MSSLAAITSLQYRIESITEKQHEILNEILSLLKRIIGKPVHNIESVIRLRETGTNTPEPDTREQSTQSPLSSQEDVNDPIYARAASTKPYSFVPDEYELGKDEDYELAQKEREEAKE
jgi:hypothetical protein